MKFVEIIADAESIETIKAVAEKVKAVDIRRGSVGDDGMRDTRLLIRDENLQEALDTLQTIMGAQPTARITVMNVEVALPKPLEDEKKPKKDPAVTARETLYAEVEKGARLDSNYLLLVFLSTVVAAIGLITNSVAVVIGAMVIAPLLGPNLALSLGTALGDSSLMKKSVLSLLAGILLALALSIVAGFIWPKNLESHELLSRTHADPAAIALALASGAAGTLSLTTGLSGALVGVMVAVALLPPTVTAGLMLGSGNSAAAGGALLLLAVNIVCVNLAGKIVFLIKGIQPRTWFEKELAKKALISYIVGWIVTLGILVFVMLV